MLAVVVSESVYRVPLGASKIPGHKSVTAAPRRLAAWLMRHNGVSYPKIAQTLNYAHHSCAIRAIRVVDRKMSESESFRGAVETAALILSKM